MLPKRFRHIKRDLVVRKARTGLGLFTNLPIEKGGFVIEYTGRVLTRREADTKGGKYLFETSQNRFVDGAVRSNTARYINHSCRPNCEIEIEKGRIYIFALRKINVGEELTYDYDDEYFDAYIKPLGCKCSKCVSKK